MAVKEKEDLFNLNNESEEDITSDEEEQDSRFHTSHLKNKHHSDSSDNSDSDQSDHEESDHEIDDSEHSDHSDEKSEGSDHEESEKDSGHEDLDSDHEGYDAPEDLREFGEHTEKGRVRTKKIKALTPQELEKFEKARKKTGVCYLSRIPPFMQPGQLRRILQKYAEIGRIFLVPEDQKIAARRKKYSKSKRVNFVEGWVEFKDKKVAKSLAEHLNLKQIGGKRKSRFYHEMWNIKYLPKFKWQHLTEQMAYEKRAREQRLRNEIAQANRENKVYISNVERAKMLQNMEEKKRKRNETTEDTMRVKRTFEQRGKVSREVDPTASGKQVIDKIDSNLQHVLGNIFGKK
ncbi:hypothetical protein BDB01DRAFT_783969 [Pilobolus umbonatus]|nr:hypothetical protein BDB01DRAFT_783969 [Pilobolus umbonatus]